MPKESSYPANFPYLEERTQATSQTVSYCAKFVHSISQVADLLNITSEIGLSSVSIHTQSTHKGPRLIKRDTAASGCSGLVIDFDKFHNSDLNFLIHVKVNNRHLVAPDLTEFSPINGTSPSDFTRLYGDTFISGFTEGGEFSALVSINVEGDSTDIRELLGTLFDFKGGPVCGGAQAGAASIEGETTIAVSWTGGGNNADTGDWTLASLRAAVFNFPQRVLSYPARTRCGFFSASTGCTADWGSLTALF